MTDGSRPFASMTLFKTLRKETLSIPGNNIEAYPLSVLKFRYWLSTETQSRRDILGIDLRFGVIDLPDRNLSEIFIEYSKLPLRSSFQRIDNPIVLRQTQRLCPAQLFFPLSYDCSYIFFTKYAIRVLF